MLYFTWFYWHHQYLEQQPSIRSFIISTHICGTVVSIHSKGDCILAPSGREVEGQGAEGERHSSVGGLGCSHCGLIAQFNSLLATNQSYWFVQQSLPNSSAISSWSLKWPQAYSRRKNARSVWHTDLASWKECCCYVWYTGSKRVKPVEAFTQQGTYSTNLVLSRPGF